MTRPKGLELFALAAKEGLFAKPPAIYETTKVAGFNLDRKLFWMDGHGAARTRMGRCVVNGDEE